MKLAFSNAVLLCIAHTALCDYGAVMTIQIKSAPLLCLDVRGGSTADGTPIDIWECNGSENQLWYFPYGSYQIRYAGDPSKCVDAGALKGGTQLKLWSCNGMAQQKWGFDARISTVYAAGSASDASLCMDLAGGSTKGGTAVQVWSCSGGWEQQWMLSPGITIRASWNYRLCLDLPGGVLDNGKNLWLWDCNGGPNQKWFFDDYKVMFAGASGKKCVDAGGKKAGEKLKIWDCNGLAQQTWGYDAKMSTVYMAGSAEEDASLCMDAAGGGYAAGVDLDLWECNGCWNQGFSVVGPAAKAVSRLSTSNVTASASKLMGCPPKPGPGPGPGPSPRPAPSPSPGSTPFTSLGCHSAADLGASSVWGPGGGKWNSCDLTSRSDGMKQCVKSNGQTDVTSLFMDMSKVASRTGCFVWEAHDCATDMTRVSKIEFDFDFQHCEDVWAAPLWITPDHWRLPGGTSGEIDFLEMCPVGSVATNFGAGGQPGETQLKWGSGTGAGGPKHFIMNLDNGGTLTTQICNSDRSGCESGAHYTNFLNRITSKYHHHFVSDIWNGHGGDGGWSGCHARTSPSTQCSYAIMNLRVSSKDGKPLYSGKCAALQGNGFAENLVASSNQTLLMI